MSSGAAARTLREREAIAEKIARVRESIRRKHRSLRTDRMDDERALETHFKPIVEPLKRLVEHTVGDDDDDGSYTVADDDVYRVKRKYEYEDADASSSAIVTPQKRRMVTPQRLKIGRQRLSATSTPLISAKLGSCERTIAGTHCSPRWSRWVGSTGRGPASRMSTIDTVYGVYIGETGTMLGDKRFDVGSDTIFVDGTRYEGTPSLYELIFMRMPDERVYTVQDTTMYRRILSTTNAHRQRFQAHRPIKSNKGFKYKQIIAPLMCIDSAAGHGGAGVEPQPPPPQSLPTMRVTDNAIDYVHWDDPNELVDRLRLIEASRDAGNDSHDAEFLSIIEELREASIITI
ncbi:hypothetical protein X777_11337 [Ooceraea biroi]|uniref:DUF8207 domain-containing protein n=1 Tax=Ooceraea biroi TaxID=2015173 RepID=A0A026W2H2_OOCBI|nr:hypothetical protein X777_11337 [Ooceraea biroi]